MPWPDFQENTGLFRGLRQKLRSQVDSGPKSHFLLGVSGGPDSMFLAYFFIWLRARDGCQLSLAHFNHQLRPGEDEKEAEALAAFAQTWQLPYYTASADVRGLAARRQAGLEEAARIARHQFFQTTLAHLRAARVQPSVGQPILALGHNQDDLIETVMINLGRGTGPDGICSMPYFDGKILRPLLVLSSQEIRDFLQQRQLTYFIDSSNLEDVYLRNRLRQEVVPAWRAALGYDPGPQILKLTESLREERQALDEIAAKALAACRLDAPDQLNLKALKLWPQGLHYRILQLFFQSYLAGQADPAPNTWASSAEAGPFILAHKQYDQIAHSLEKLPGQACFNLGGGLIFRVQGYLGQVTLVI